MKVVAALLIALAFGCSPEQKSVEPMFSSQADTVQMVVNIYNKMAHQITDLNKKYLASGIENAHLRAQIDTIQILMIKYQNNAIKLIALEAKLEKLKGIYRDMISDMVVMQEQMMVLEDSNEQISVREEQQRSVIKQIVYENEEMKASQKFKIAGVTLKAFGYSKHGSADTIETHLASKAKYIELYFVVVENDRIENKTYVLNCTLHGAGNGRGVSKDMLVHFTGTEQKIIPIKFYDPIDGFRVGPHRVDVKLNGEILFNGEILLN